MVGKSGRVLVRVDAGDLWSIKDTLYWLYHWTKDLRNMQPLSAEVRCALCQRGTEANKWYRFLEEEQTKRARKAREQRREERRQRKLNKQGAT